jgi:Arc/MetJ-type ribon-helix-helix transcriptional regulator
MAKRKVTLLMDERLTDRMRAAIAEGAARSQTALIEQAVTRFLEEHRREWLRREWEDAARDPRFLRDIEETMQAFATADVETARLIDGD